MSTWLSFSNKFTITSHTYDAISKKFNWRLYCRSRNVFWHVCINSHPSFFKDLQKTTFYEFDGNLIWIQMYVPYIGSSNTTDSKKVETKVTNVSYIFLLSSSFVFVEKYPSQQTYRFSEPDIGNHHLTVLVNLGT